MSYIDIQELLASAFNACLTWFHSILTPTGTIFFFTFFIVFIACRVLLMPLVGTRIYSRFSGSSDSVSSKPKNDTNPVNNRGNWSHYVNKK